MDFKDCPTLSDYIARAQVDGVLWKAEKLLANLDNPIQRNERVADIARTIAMLPQGQAIVKDDYIRKISTEYKITRKTLEKLVADHTVIERKKNDITRAVRKNSVTKLNGEAKTFPFFVELITENKKTNEKIFKGIKIDKLKFVQLLKSFGFTRYASDVDSKDGFTFVRLQDNVIVEVATEDIKDFIEDFITKDYDFEAAGCEYVDSDLMLNHMYDTMKAIFNKDLFARARNSDPIIINRDTATECFLYFKNGFVRVTKDGYTLFGYDKMEGSVWGKQMLERNFEVREPQIVVNEDGAPDWENSFSADRPLGVFADFVWRICGAKQQRFIALCSILGYLVHDYYNYKLKAILFTDSSVSDRSEGRTGKTLLGKMLALVRSMTEINGKDFDAANKNKFEDVSRATQIVHLNDVRNKGRFKFDFEDVFNDVTEGFMVNAKFRTPFRHITKFIISSNRTLPIEGDSQRDRIVEFEMSNFFNSGRSPQFYYGHWFGQDWSEEEYSRFDNFICFCVQAFLTHGLIAPDTINLEARKLLDGTSREFLEYMGDILAHLREFKTPWNGYTENSTNNNILFTPEGSDIATTFEFDKKQLFDRFLILYPDYKANHFTQKRFTDWLRKYASLALGCADPIERRSNTLFFIQFKNAKS